MKMMEKPLTSEYAQINTVTPNHDDPWMATVVKASNSTSALVIGALLATLLFPLVVQAGESLIGKAVRIIDGDTLVLLNDDNQQIRIRLAGIDTPEKKQPFGKRAKQALIELAAGKIIIGDCPKMDHYGRRICKIKVESVDLGLELIRRGFAWHYRKYAHEQSPEDRKAYADSEDQAKKNRIGLWTDPSPVPPWQWRHR